MTPRQYPELTTCSGRLDEFERLCEQGKAYNALTGERGPISKATTASIITTVRHAMIRASDTTRLDEVEFEPLLNAISGTETLLERHAVDGAREEGRSNPNNEGTRVRRFIATLLGSVPKRGFQGDRSVPKQWRPLLEAIDKIALSDDRRHIRSAVRRIATSASVRRIQDPADLPDRATVLDWLGQDGVNAATARRYVRAYNLLRRVCTQDGGVGSPASLEGQVHDLRGIRTVENFAERIAAAGFKGAPTEITVEEALRLLYPRMHQAYQTHLADPRTNRQRNGGYWKKAALGALSRFAAAADRSPEVRAAMDGVKCMRQLAPADLFGRKAVLSRIDTATAEFSDIFGVTEGGIVEDAKPLFWILMDQMRIPSVAASPLEITDEKLKNELYYTDTQLQDMYSLWAVFQSDIRKSHGPAAPKAVEQLQPTYDEAKKAFSEHNKTIPTNERRDKVALLTLVNYGELVAVGLPALLEKVERLEAEYLAAHVRLGPRSRTTREARSRYFRWERRYIALALALDDGMRIANYVGARLGHASHYKKKVTHASREGATLRTNVHCAPRLVKDQDGTVTGFEHVEMTFYGDDHDRVKLKIAKNQNGSARWRPHTIRNTVLDLDRFYRYLSGQRVDDLISAGLVESREAYDLEEDIHHLNYAVFVSPRATSKCPYSMITGAYATDGPLRSWFGQALHWVITKALGRSLGPWGRDLKKRFPFLFTNHIVRLETGTHFYGICNEPGFVENLLNDTLATIGKSYSTTDPELQNLSGVRHLAFFRPLTERTLTAWKTGHRGTPVTLDDTRQHLIANSIPEDQWPPALIA